jgi:hypothetical protein
MGKIKIPQLLPEVDTNLKLTLAIIGLFATFILLYLSLIGLGGPAGDTLNQLMKMILGRVSFFFPVLFFGSWSDVNQGSTRS